MYWNKIFNKHPFILQEKVALFDQNSVLWWWYWSDLSRVQAWMMVHGGHALSRLYGLPLSRTNKIQIQGTTFEANLAVGVAGRLSALTANCLWHFTLDFLPFLCLDLTTRQWRFKIWVFSSVKLHLPKSSVLT